MGADCGGDHVSRPAVSWIGCVVALVAGCAVERVCICSDSSARLGWGAVNHGAGLHLFFSAPVAEKLDRADDSPCVEQWDDVHGNAFAVVRMDELNLPAR